MKIKNGVIPAWALAILSGLILWVAWPVSPFAFLSFFGFIPLLYLGVVTPSRGKFFLLSGLAMLVWNATTTWWIWNASEIGAVAAFLVNTLVMTVPWMVYHIMVNRKGITWGLWVWLLCWMSVEYFHLQDWGLSWPWLTLGNVFAGNPNWVQWYSITGSSGGTAWVLLVNLLLFQLMSGTSNVRRHSIYTAAALVFPLVVSAVVLSSWSQKLKEGTKNIVVVQPNVDAYSEKFAAGTQESQIHQLISLSESQINENTALVIWPETAIPVQAWEESIRQNFFYYPVFDFLRRHPQLELFSGIDGYRKIPKGEPLRISARKLGDTDEYYEAYNSGALFGKDTSIQIYHKSKLVPGAEMIPGWLSFMTSLVDDFGGIAGAYGSQAERTVLSNPSSTFKIAPSICYESIYGEFMAEYARHGANLIAIITNDGWWGNTPGYRQHMQYARLRAIENRRWVARSANTGISCFIDPLGNIYDPQPWDKAAAIRHTILPDQELSFFSENGDLLSKAAVVLLLLSLVAGFLPQRKYIKT